MILELTAFDQLHVHLELFFFTVVEFYGTYLENRTAQFVSQGVFLQTSPAEFQVNADISVAEYHEKSGGTLCGIPVKCIRDRFEIPPRIVFGIRL